MRYLIVDGQSVIAAWPELRLHGRRTGAARDELVRQLTRIRTPAASGSSRFSGKGVKPNEATEPGIQIFIRAPGNPRT
jgi:hypothetical protein